MITPARLSSIMRRATAWEAKKVALTLRIHSRSNVSRLTSRNGSGWLAPAQFTSTSTGPTLSIRASHLVLVSVTSHGWRDVSAPDSRAASATGRARRAERARSVRRAAPARAHASAMAAPIPRLAPVIMTRLPARGFSSTRSWTGGALTAPVPSRPRRGSRGRHVEAVVSTRGGPSHAGSHARRAASRAVSSCASSSS